ncbi:MAG TPA: serine/threonine-protein kinase [Polyangiaceae bacterium]|nr:serine/threonine-protein kinase [Polyangiaceae bacterium]
MSSTPRKVESKPTRARSLVTKSTPSPVSEPQPLTLPFAPGDVIGEKYEVVGVLGSGGVAYVISALHLELGEMVALKFLRPESLEHEDVVARFASEARAVARIKSEHVAHVFDVGTLPDGAPFIVMEYLEGKDLADTLAEKRKLPIKVAVDYVLQACEALACAHAAGIVHRDIKPENLFLTQQAASVECIKVLDFGISKSAMAGFEPAGRRFAQTMLPMGTPGYMSPEQIRACGTVDARTDIWALGCVLSELITGATAFHAPTLLQLGAAILEREPIPLRKGAPDAPAELEAIVMKCLQKDPDQRYQDVAELAAALYRFGPRRSRISAERCHQVLKGRSGIVIEFNSVPPPSLGGSTPLPVSSMGPTVNSTPALGLGPASAELGAASLLDVPFARKKRGKTLLAGAVVALAVLAGIALGVAPHAANKTAAVAPPAAPTLTAPAVTAPAAAPIDHTPSRSAAPAAPAADAASVDAPAPVAATGARPHGKPARAPRVAPAPAARQEAAVPSAKPKAIVAKRPGLDDSEPDVGY